MSGSPRAQRAHTVSTEAAVDGEVAAASVDALYDEVYGKDFLRELVSRSFRLNQQNALRRIHVDPRAYVHPSLEHFFVSLGVAERRDGLLYLTPRGRVVIELLAESA